MRALILDPFAGISGDMFLAALLDLGLPLEWLRDFVQGLGVAEIELDARRADRRGIACTQLVLRLPHEHAHRHLADVVGIIEGAGVSERVRDRAIAAFTTLAEAEAEVHGTTRDRVHFHEVGALDAIVDVLGAMAAVEQMGFEAFYTRPVALGRGWAEMAHGSFPVPPPAVLKLLQGVRVRDPSFEGECTTPTGAALVQTLTGGNEPPAAWTPLASGFGAGTRDPQDRPNCLRLIDARLEQDPAESLLVLQTDVDDLSPEYVPPLLQALLDAGARDATATPLLMKKGRPGVRLEALVRQGRLEPVRAALFRNTTSIGARWWPVDRHALPRREQAVEWRGQQVRVKRSKLPGGGERAKPEFDDVVRAAEALGLTPWAAYRAMLSDGVAADE